MSYAKNIVLMPSRPRRAVYRTGGIAGLGDWWGDLMASLGLGPASNAPSVPGGTIGSGETTSDSSSTTTQDTGVTSSGGTVGGQDTGVPSAPTSAWQNVGGVCYATSTGGLLDTFKELQRQLNRVASNQSWALLAVDGSIGPATMAMIAQVAGLGAYSSVGFAASVASCDTVASNVYALVGATQAYADTLGVSSSVSSPSGSPQVFNPASGTLEGQGVAGSVSDVWGNLSTTGQIALAAGAVGVLWYATSQGKKYASQARSTTRRTTRRRTTRRY